MLRRIRYDITGKPFSFLFQSVMYTVLFTFLFGSLLMVSLSDVFEFTAGRTMSLDITLYGDETSPLDVDNGYYTPDYTDQQKQYIEAVKDLGNREGVVYRDVNVNAMNTPFHVGSFYEDGSWDFMMERTMNQEITSSINELYAYQPDLSPAGGTGEGVSVPAFQD